MVIFNYLESRQLVRQREFDNIAVRNQVFLRVALAFSELLRSEGQRAVALQAREEAQAIAKLTADYAVTGQGRYADANRAATDLQRREAYLKQVESELLTSSARLCQLLNLDPSIRLHPTDAYVVPHPLVPDPIAVGELIALGLLRRPELAAQRASVIQGLLLLDEAKALPFSPTIYIGYQRRWFRRRQQPGPADLRRLRGPERFRRDGLLDHPEPRRRQRRHDPSRERQPPGPQIRANRDAQPGTCRGGRGLRQDTCAVRADRDQRIGDQVRPAFLHPGPRRGSGTGRATSCRSSC